MAQDKKNNGVISLVWQVSESCTIVQKDTHVSEIIGIAIDTLRSLESIR